MALQVGDNGHDVYLWQVFLLGQGITLPSGADAAFGGETDTGTRAFQALHGLPANGTVDAATLNQAQALGFVTTVPGAAPLPAEAWKFGADWPAAPKDLRAPSVAHQQAALGPLTYVGQAGTDNITITNGFEAANIVSVTLPQLVGIQGARPDGRINWHRAGVPQLVALWRAWEAQGLLSRALTWDGSYVARFVRPDPSKPVPPWQNRSLSNHAFGAAFDINYAWNKLAHVPALVGQTGCVRELVPTANALGFFWGGHFSGRPDGMHFEIARLMTSAEIAAAGF